MITRRQFLHLSAAAAALSLTGSIRAQPDTTPAAAPAATKKRKKGLGRSTKTPLWDKNLTDLRCNWFYSWNSVRPDGVPPGLEFVPMIYRHAGNEKSTSQVVAAAASARKHGTNELLGFNEPEKKEQGNMTLEAALNTWPELMETGLRLGSPGCVHPDKEWMIAFMDGVKQRGLRVDFICVHSYGGPNADSLVKRLEKVHQMFGERPIWITEFGVGDWAAKKPEQNRHKPETVLRFMEDILPRLEKLDFVERYAWFPSGPKSGPLGTSALYDETGALTRLGECYRDLA
jgi:hypothetical protein